VSEECPLSASKHIALLSRDDLNLGLCVQYNEYSECESNYMPANKKQMCFLTKLGGTLSGEVMKDTKVF